MIQTFKSNWGLGIGFLESFWTNGAMAFSSRNPVSMVMVMMNHDGGGGEVGWPPTRAQYR